MEAFQHPWSVLGTLLLRDGLVTEEQLSHAVERQRLTGEKLGAILVSRGIVTAAELAAALAEQHDLPLLELEESEIDQDAARLLPEDFARRHCSLPVRFGSDGRLLVAVADPSSLHVHELERILGAPLRLSVSASDAIESAIERVHVPRPPTSDAGPALVSADTEDLSEESHVGAGYALVSQTEVVNDETEFDQEGHQPRLGSLLLRDGLVSHDEIESALAQQRISLSRLGEILVQRGTVTSAQVARLLAEQHDLPFLELDPFDVDREAARLLSEEIARSKRAIPIRHLPEGPLLVALADPADVFQVERFRLELGIPLRFVVATPEAIEAAIELVHMQSQPVEETGSELPSEAEDTVSERSSEAEESGSELPSEAEDTVSERSPEQVGGSARVEAARSWPALGSLLMRDGLLTEEELDHALFVQRESGRRLGEILVERGVVTRAQVARVLAEQHELTFVELEESELDTEAAILLPEELARRYSALPVGFLPDGSLLVAASDPTNVLYSDELRLALGVPIRFGVAVPEAVDAAIALVHQHSLPLVEDDEAETTSVAGVVDVHVADSDTPAVPHVNETIQRALSLGASDIHFSPQPHALVIRARVDGVVREIGAIPSSEQAAVISRLKIMGRLDIAERRAPQDSRVAVHAGDQTVDLRIAVLPTKFGEKVTLRVLNQASAPGSLSDLALAPDDEETIRRAIHQPFGAVFACGPTGSGKTTTLYAALQELHTPERTLTTIEDPVEYLTPGIDQTEVNPGAGLTFARGLRTILHSDPDVILVGEIRDEETAEIAVRAAMTGHLVLSTLHTQTAASAVQRLTGMGIESGLLGATLTCLVSQRLVRRVCLDCRETYYATAEELKELGRPEEEPGTRLLARGHGCAACGGTGYRGRVGLFEVLALTDEIRELVAGRASTTEIHRAAVAGGMRALREDGIRLCLEGVTTPSEMRRVVGDRP